MSTFDVFISYSRSDDLGADGPGSGPVSALCKFIENHVLLPGNAQIRVFVDFEGIRDYDDWRHRILSALRHSKILLVCLSPNYFASDYCKWEWQHFLGRQGHRNLRGEGESIQSIKLAALPPQLEEKYPEWWSSVRRSNTLDFDWPSNKASMTCGAPLEQAARIADSIAQRVRLARSELAHRYGNLRAATEHFVGRASLLRALHETVALGENGAITVLHGLGGMGKSELALQYANEYARSFPAGIWWIDAEPFSDLRSAIASLAYAPDFLDKHEEPETDAAKRFEQVLAVLKQMAEVRDVDSDEMGKILLILDNVEDLALLGANQRSLIGNLHWLSALATTRQSMQSWTKADLLVSLPVDALEEPDAVALLREWQPDHAFRDDDENAATQLAIALGCYTLAIEQSAIYLGTHPNLRFADFLARLTEHGLPVLDFVADDNDVRSTVHHREKRLKLVLDQTLPPLGTPERVVLDSCACWGPQFVPLPWVRQMVETDRPQLFANHSGFPPADRWSDAVRWLEQRRLLTSQSKSSLGRIHKLVHAHLQLVLNSAVKRSADTIAVWNSRKIESEAYRDLSLPPWEIEALIAWSMQTDALSYEKSVALAVTAQWMAHFRGAGKAEPVIRKALDFFDTRVAAGNATYEEQRALALTSNTNADILAMKGEYAAALAQAEHAIGIFKALRSVFPKNASLMHDLGVTIGRLASFKAKQGDAQGAEKDISTSLTLFELSAASDPSMVRTALRDASISLSARGDLRLDQNLLDEALADFQRSLDIREQLALGNSSDWNSQRDLGGAHERLGKLRIQSGDIHGAIASYTKSLAISERLHEVRPDSVRFKSDVATLLLRLGEAYIALGEYSIAQDRLLQCLVVRTELANSDILNERMQGDVAVVLDCMCEVATKQGQFKEAYALAQRSLDAKSKLPKTVESLRGLAATQERLFRSATDIKTQLKHLREIDRICSELSSFNVQLSSQETVGCAWVRQALAAILNVTIDSSDR